MLKNTSWWQTRHDQVKAMLDKFKLPLVERAMELLKKSDSGLTDSFGDRLRALDGVLEEAHDNNTFLDTIQRHLAVIIEESDFATVSTALGKLTHTLRSAWMLSKHYNSDQKIVGLLEKVTHLILVKVKRQVDQSSLSRETVEEHNEKARVSVALLKEWHAVFLSTKLAIEKSGREARWEFSVRDIFSRVENHRKTCQDVVDATAIIIKLEKYFSPELRLATKKVDFVDVAVERLEQLTKSFCNLGFDLFSRKEKHHWENHLSWFYREVNFLEINALGEVDEVFERLADTKASIVAVDKILRGDHAPHLRAAIERNLPKGPCQVHGRGGSQERVLLHQPVESPSHA